MSPDGVSEASELFCKITHKWLGVFWPQDLVFASAMHEVVARATKVVRDLVSLIAARSVPLTMASEMFECKVDSVLNCGRWLFALAPSACRVLDQELECWARALLGAQAWRNGSVCCCEMGLLLTGHARAVRSVAFRRARAWAMKSGDWYKRFFLHNASTDIGWAAASLVLLGEWGVVDWPLCVAQYPTLGSYQAYVDQVLLRKCVAMRSEQVQSHNASIPYYTFQPHPADLLSTCRSLNFSWQLQLTLRGWCRVRAGIACLSSVFGKPSRADRPSPNQLCIFCRCGISRNATKHALAACKHWQELRGAFMSVRELVGLPADEVCTALLRTQPGDTGFAEAVTLFSRIDEGASLYWASV